MDRAVFYYYALDNSLRGVNGMTSDELISGALPGWKGLTSSMVIRLSDTVFLWQI